MSKDLAAVAKNVAHSVARGAEKGGKAIVEHYKSIGTNILKSNALYKDMEADAKKSAENIGRGAAKDAEHAGKELGSPAKSGLDRVFGRKGAHSGTGDLPCEGDPVDLATGDVLFSETDVTLPGVLPLVLERTHRSSMDTGRWFGSSWMSSLDQRLLVTPDRVIGAFADGRVLSWPHPGGSADAAVPASGPPWQLRRHLDGSYSVHDPQRGLTWRFEHRDGYDAELPLVSVADRIGHEIAFHHDEAGRPLRVTHSGGYRVLVTIAGEHVTGLILAGRDGEDDVPLRRFGYDDDGNLSGVVNSSGLPMRFAYDDAGRMTSWTDRNGRSYRYAYDDEGRCVRCDGPGGMMSGTFGYEPGITRWTDADGAVTVHQIGARGQLTATTDPLGRTARWEHDDRGNVVTHIDPLGRITRYAYDDRGNMTAVTRPDGRQARAEYDGTGLPVTVTDADGTTWSQEYDDRGNRTALVAPDGGVTRYGYDDSGHLASVTDPAGARTEITENAAGLPVAITAPDGGRTRYDRNAAGLVAEITSPDGAATSLSWTVEGRLTRRSHPDGAAESWSYDAEGNLVSYLNPVGDTTTYEYGPFDQPTAMTGPDGTRTESGYDRQLRLTSVTHGGLSWRYRYDAGGRLTAETDYNDATTTYAYDAADQLTSKVNAVGQRVAFGYDDLGNQTEQVADGVVTTFEYDAVGRLVRAANPDSDLRFERDRLGRVTSQTGNGRTVASEYDEAGRPVRRVTPAGHAASWRYGPAGQPVAMSADGHEIRFDYDRAGRETRRDLPGGLTLAQDWDQRGRLTRQELTGGSVAPGRVLQRRAYAYRPDSLVAGIEDLLGGDRGIGLDRSGRVTAVTGQDWAERYSYDQAGNVIAAAWPVLPLAASSPGPSAASSAAAEVWRDAGAQGDREVTGTLVTRAGNLRYRYDRQGRVIRRQRTRVSRRPETWHYEWDAENRLTAVTTPDGARWRYLYDPLGRRIAKRRLSPDGTVMEQTEFTWDGAVLVEQVATRTGLPTREVVTWNYEPGTGTPITQTERTSPREAPQDEIDQRFYAIVTDLAGTPAELVRPDGTLAGHRVQTLWGGTTWGSDGASTPLRFPGQYEDPETGLHYNNQRYYDPSSGAYLSPDPLGLAPSPNPHAYVPNPQVLIDPLGLAGCGGLRAGLKARFHEAKRLINVPRAWLNNRRLASSLHGTPPEANATVRDLLDLTPGNPQRPAKLASGTARSDEDLLKSVFAPRDNQFIATNRSMPDTILQGNHRAYQLLSRANDPEHPGITLDTPIFINRGDW